MKGRTQRFVTGHRLITSDKKNKVINGKRTCKQPGCTTTLSRYNKKDKCWVHITESEPLKVPRLRGTKSENLTIDVHVR